MNVSLVVPAPQDGAERIRNWAWLRKRYERAFPDWEIVESALRPDPWSKGAVVNAGARCATGAVLVLADADVLVAPDVLRHALTALSEGAEWVVPYERVYRLSEPATANLIAGRSSTTPRPLPLRHLERAVHRGPAGGGVVVVRAEHFREVNGMDPRFTTWGGDDEAFGRALDTLVGPHKRLNHPAWHLWHPTLRPDNGRGSTANEALASRYLVASGNPDAMTVLCARAT